MGDEDDADDPKAMQFAKMDVPEAYMATNDEELVLKLEQVRGLCATTTTNQYLQAFLDTFSKPFEKNRKRLTNAPFRFGPLFGMLCTCCRKRAVDATKS